jgi:hypothetical protein
MALNFPSPATDGQTYTAEGVTYIYQSGRWLVLVPAGGGVYLPLTGGTLTGLLTGTIAKFGNVYIGASPTGAAAPNNVSAATGSNLILRGGIDTTALIQFVNSTGAEVARIDPAGTALADAQSIVTQEKGDARYVNLGGTANNGMTRIRDIIIGGTPAAAAQDNAVSSITGVQLVLRAGLSTGSLINLVDSAGVSVAVIAPGGTATLGVTTVLTREKGGALYAPISSRRFKENIAPTTFDALDIVSQLQPQVWVWGGEVHPTHERYGTVGIGLISEDVEAILPAAVTYQWVPDEEGMDTDVKVPHGLDALALIGVLVKAVQELTARIAALESV